MWKASQDYWREKNRRYREQHPYYGSLWVHDKRRKALEVLGNKCVRCGFNDWRALQIDHKFGCGSRKTGTRLSSSALYMGLIKGTIDRSVYQILCANCNYIKRFENGEVGSGRAPKMVIYLKEVEQRYGAKS